jgi:hypothetical protein
MIRWANDRIQTLREIEEKENSATVKNAFSPYLAKAGPKSCPPKRYTPAPRSRFGTITPFPAKMRQMKRKSEAVEPRADPKSPAKEDNPFASAKRMKMT